MLLNLAIIKDALTEEHILQTSIDKLAERTLKYLKLYEKEEPLDAQHLYITNAENLPLSPEFSGHLSIVCLGYLPPAYLEKDGCEYLCLSISTDIGNLFQKILKIFYYYNDFDDRIKDMMIQGCELSDLEAIALEIFRTPVSVYGNYEKILLMAYDENRPESLELYQSYSREQEYLPDDEKSVLYATREFVDTFSTHGPAYSYMDVYETQIIYINIFDQNNYKGRVVVENAYRDFTDGDYGLTEWFGGYVEILMNKSRQFYFQTSREFEQMFQELYRKHGTYRKEFDNVLAEANWKVNDQYLCISTTSGQMSQMEQAINNAAYYLTELLDSQYIFVQQNYIFQTINISRSEFSYHEIIRRLKIFLENNVMTAGMSTLFTNFQEIQRYIRQSMLMTEFALADHQKKLYEFDENVLSMMLSKLRQEDYGNVYFTKSINDLFIYDAENETNLVKTLQCYIENSMSVSKTTEQLYIARTTCLYRLKRIREITHLSLENPTVNLYLRLILTLLPKASQKIQNP